MMREKEELRESLRQGTSLVAEVVQGRISIAEFVVRYDNFFYYEALDGHEADAQEHQLLDEYREIISLHEQVQTSVVDLIYLDNDGRREEFLAAGRIDPETAARRLGDLTRQYKLTSWLQELGCE